jgi:LPS sulfotransferase NodH
MISNHIICATPRSGSNMLCEVLSSLGKMLTAVA